MSQENFWILFSKKVAGEASAEELKELEALIQEHPEWQYALQNIEDIWKTNPPVNPEEEEDAYLLHRQLIQEKNIGFPDGQEALPGSTPVPWQTRRPLRRILFTAGSIAASLLLLMLLLWFVLPSKKQQLPVAKEVNEISTQPKSRSRIQLPDNSIVWLNAGSKLTYNKDFGKTSRDVSLTGEAFFDVTRNEDIPFLIHTSSITIKVLGTAFNVKAYPEDETTETSLVRGSIEVSIKSRPKDKIILSPNEKLVVENHISTDSDSVHRPTNGPLVTINKLQYNPVDSTIAETQWINNKLVFNNESLAELAVKMERWYGVHIEITDQQLKEKRFTGSFDDENIEQAMEALTYTRPFKFEIQGNNIIIHP